MDSKEYGNAKDDGSIMKILDCDQGSAEWLTLRLNKITGTDAAILTGSNIWKSKLELWEQKLGLREPDKVNEKMQRGSDLEEPARRLLNQYTEIEFKAAVFISERFPYMMASLDGLSPCLRFMCEIKSPSIKSHEAAIEGMIADYYQDQIQHCLTVTGCEMCYYCSYFPGHEREIEIINVYPDLEKQAEIIAKGQEFYINMCTMNPPTDWKLKERK